MATDPIDTEFFFLLIKAQFERDQGARRRLSGELVARIASSTPRDFVFFKPMRRP